MRSIDEQSLDEQQLHDLVAAAKAGNHAALHDLIAWAMDYLFPAVLSMLHERRQKGTYISETLHTGGADLLERLRDDAWAITHSACCRMTLRLDSFRGRNALGRKVQFATWVYAIARNDMRTLLRDRWRERKRYGGSRDQFGGIEWRSGNIVGADRRSGSGGSSGAGGGSGSGGSSDASDANNVSDTSGRSDAMAANRAVRDRSATGGGRVRSSPELIGHDPSPESAVLDQLDNELVREALHKAPLTPEQREAVVLFHGYGYRQEQIAALTGVQVGTVKKRIFDGLRKLKEYVNERSVG